MVYGRYNELVNGGYFRISWFRNQQTQLTGGPHPVAVVGLSFVSWSSFGWSKIFTVTCSAGSTGSLESVVSSTVGSSGSARPLVVAGDYPLVV